MSCHWCLLNNSAECQCQPTQTQPLTHQEDKVATGYSQFQGIFGNQFYLPESPISKDNEKPERRGMTIGKSSESLKEKCRLGRSKRPLESNKSTGNLPEVKRQKTTVGKKTPEWKALNLNWDDDQLEETPSKIGIKFGNKRLTVYFR